MNDQFDTYVNRMKQGSIKWREMKEHNPNIPDTIIPYSVADSDLKHPEALIEGLKDHLDTMILGYTMPNESYYEALRMWYQKRHQWSVRKESIIDSNGVVSALFNLVDAFTNIGDGVLILSPVYYPFKMSIELQERRIIESRLVLQNETYTIDFDDLEEKAKDPRTKLLIFCSPHNPVGRVWSVEELKRVNDICVRHKVLVVSDEIHFDLIMPGFQHTVFSTVDQSAKDNTIVVTAASKSFNLAGLQTSAIIIENESLRNEFEASMRKKGFHALNAIGPKATEIAYRACEGWLDDFIALIDVNRNVFASFMKEYIPEIVVYPLEGTYLQWFDCTALGFGADELNDFLKDECGLYLDPGVLFDEKSSQFQRINLACPTEKLIEGLKRLRDELKK